MMRVRKAELAEAIKRRMKQLGATNQLKMAALLRREGLTVSQPTLSRLLKGGYEGVPPSLIDVCNYAKISLNKFVVEIDPASSPKLIAALRAAWDGSPQREAFLARVIKAAGKFNPS